jgi:heat shock protein HtpX
LVAFAPDRGLQLRMLLAMLATPLMVLGSVAVVIVFAPAEVVTGFVIAVVVGIVVGAVELADREPESLPVDIDDAPELHAVVERLCVLADLAKPELVVENEFQPNSWIVWLSRGRARLHVTTGLRTVLPPAELEAVIAHELAHLAHHDAAVISAASGPGSVLLEGARRMGRSGWWLAMPIALVIAAAIGGLSRLATLALSRHRELAADAASAALTGRPVALASALWRISEAQRLLGAADRRAAAGRDLYQVVPTDEREAFGRPRLTATHPPLLERIDRLLRLEHQLQSARLVDRG